MQVQRREGDRRVDMTPALDQFLIRDESWRVRQAFLRIYWQWAQIKFLIHCKRPIPCRGVDRMNPTTTQALVTRQDAHILRHIHYIDPITLRCRCEGCRGEFVVWEALDDHERARIISRQVS